MKRVLWIVTALLLILAPCVLATGTAEGTPEGPASGELTFWHPYSGSRIDSLGAAAARFEQDNPGWTVKLEKIGWGEDMRNKWVTGLASRTLPDLFGATLDHALAMFDAGAGVDATPGIAALGGRSAFLEQPLETLRYKGAYIALPHYGHAKVFYYRQDWLDELGFSVPTTWNEFRTVAAALTDPPNRYGFVVPLSKDGNLAVDYLYIFMTSNGGAFFDANGNVVLNSPQNVEAVQLLMDLYRTASPEGSLAYTDRDRDDLILRGMNGMTFEPLFLSATINANAPELLPKFGVAPPPGQKTVGWMSEHLVTVMCADSEYEQKRLELIPYFYAEEEYVRFLHHAPGGMLPVLKTTADSARFWQNEYMQSHRDDIEVAIQGYSLGTPVGMANGVNSYAGLLKGTDVIKNMLHEIVAGKPIEQALAETHRRLEQMVAEQ